MKYHLSRKYILSVLSIISSTGLVAMGMIADGVYSAVMIATVAAYITGNVIDKK